MDEPRILISGDYWHQEFQNIISSFPVPATLAPLDRINRVLCEPYDLVVLVQSRPDQIPGEMVEQIQAAQPTVPVVALLGSWCEGGMRSDVPWPGVRRIYWHQWNGRFEQFSKQLASEGISLWHQPRTASGADDALYMSDPAALNDIRQVMVMISSSGQAQYEYLRDAIESIGWRACWAERTTWDRSTTKMVSLLCVDGNSVTDELVSRIEWLRSKLEQLPMVLVLSFPRTQDVDVAASLGATEIVSKPFRLVDLKYAIETAIERRKLTESPTDANATPGCAGSGAGT